MFMAQNGLCPLSAEKANARQQACDPRHIVGPGLYAVRQEVRHLLTERNTPRAALQQRSRDLTVPAQEHTGALWAVQPLVSRHGNIRRPKAFHIDRQDTGRLGGVHDQRHPPAAAKRRHLFNGLDKAEHIGHMIADHGVHTGDDQLVKGPGSLPPDRTAVRLLRTPWLLGPSAVE